MFHNLAEWQKASRFHVFLASAHMLVKPTVLF